MKTQQFSLPLECQALLALCAFLFACATPGPPPRARVAVELLQGFPAALEEGAEASVTPGEHVVLLIDVTTSMQTQNEAASETRARAANAAASRLLDSLGAERSVEVWTLGASEEGCAPARRGMPSLAPEQLARAGEGSLALALEKIATRLEATRFDGQTSDLASRTLRRARVVTFTDLGDECGGDLCSAASHLAEVGAQLELTLFGDVSVPQCLADLQLGETFIPPMRVEDRRPGTARFWVESAESIEPAGEGVLVAGRADGAPRTLLSGRVYIHVELDQPARFGPIDLAPNTETRLRILDFPGLVPPVREWSWQTRNIPLAKEAPASIDP